MSIQITGRSKDSEAPLVVKPARACQMLSCGRTRLYQLLAAKELDSFVDGGSRKVTVASIHRYIERQLVKQGTFQSIQAFGCKTDNNQPQPDQSLTSKKQYGQSLAVPQ